MAEACAVENRESFFKRIAPVLSAGDLRQVELAYLLAKKCHDWQTRQELDRDGRPVRYFEHLRRVALVLIDEVGSADATLIVAALLHDSLEDTRDLTPELIEHCFGSDVLRIVKQISKVPKGGYIERLQKYGCWQALLVKACDRLDNLRSLTAGSIEFQKKQTAETRDKYFALFEKMVRVVPGEYRAAAGELRDKIVAEVVSHETRLAQIGNGSSGPATPEPPQSK